MLKITGTVISRCALLNYTRIVTRRIAMSAERRYNRPTDASKPRRFRTVLSLPPRTVLANGQIVT